MTSPHTDRPQTGSRGLLGFGDPSRRFQFWWAIALLTSNIVIIGTGGAVRLTASGLGCPTWPECTSGSIVPSEELGMHGAIEFGNRLLTWVLIVIAIGTWIAVMRARPADRTSRILATLVALGIPMQGVIGGITVLTQLNPWVVAFHFLLSVALVSLATWLVWRIGGFTIDDSDVHPLIRRIGLVLAWTLYVLTWATVYLGTVVTGAGPHAGDPDSPRNGLSPQLASQLHADGVFLLVGVALALLLLVWVAGLPQRRTVNWFFVILLAQGIIGLVQHFTGLPIGLVLAHMVGSAALMVSATLVVLAFAANRDLPSVPPRDGATQTAEPVPA